MCTDPDKTILIEVFGGFLAYIGNIGCKLFKTTFGITYLKKVFIDMDEVK
jgi:hypothetical protein